MKKYNCTPEKRRSYYETFKLNNEDKLKEGHICDICEGTYNYYYKSQHMRAKKHIMALKIINKLTLPSLISSN
jgi:hypothetical protein